MGATETQVLTERMTDIINSKLAEAEALPNAVAEYVDRKNGRRYKTFVVSGGSIAAKVTYDASGRQHEVVFATNSSPAYRLKINDYGTIGVDYAGNKADEPDMVAQLDQLAIMVVLSNELVPYGWVEEGIVTAIICTGNFYQFKLGDMIVNTAGSECYVLEGQTLPSELKRTHGDIVEYAARFWQLVKTGKLVRLTRQINEIGTHAWAESDGSSRGWIRFTMRNLQAPFLAVDQKYISWSQLEAYPGELFTSYVADGYDTGYTNSLHNWFR